jgi:hypothetical protein
VNQIYITIRRTDLGGGGGGGEEKQKEKTNPKSVVREEARGV